jgi:hypothetical protein
MNSQSEIKGFLCVILNVLREFSNKKSHQNTAGKSARKQYTSPN